MSKNIFLILVYLLVGKFSYSQSTLEQYIQEGLTKNQSIQQQQFAYEKSVYALKEAKALFLPKISLVTDYFLAGGGRTIDFPTGDLLNNAYSSLNQLTNSNNFPQLENERILLNPDNFYDAKFRTTLPLLNPEIEYNKRVKKEQVSMQQVEIDLYKRELVKEIKVAYFTYLQSVQAIKIYDFALEILEESKRVNESLFNNDKANRLVVLRSQNEIVRIEAIRLNAQENSNSAQAYFNFLLNKDFNNSIKIDSTYQSVAVSFADSASVSQREELLKLKIAGSINQHLSDLSKSYIIPKINTFLDLGSQGFDWQFDNRSRYYFFGVSLQWDLFSSGKNFNKVQQARLDNKIVQSQSDYITDQLQLQFTTTVNNFNSSIASYQASVSVFKTAQTYYKDMLRLYKEGQALFIELLDAQNQLIQSELQVNISLYDTYIKAADIERADATYNLNNY